MPNDKNYSEDELSVIALIVVEIFLAMVLVCASLYVGVTYILPFVVYQSIENPVAVIIASSLGLLLLVKMFVSIIKK